MSTSFYTVNLRRTLDEKDSAYMGEKALISLLDEFSCPPNREVERFLRRSSIEFTKRNQSVTYLVFSRALYSDLLVGYFTLTIKPIYWCNFCGLFETFVIDFCFLIAPRKKIRASRHPQKAMPRGAFTYHTLLIIIEAAKSLSWPPF